MIGAAEVAVVPERIAHRDVEVSLRSPRAGVKALMDVAVRHAPQQPLGCDALALHSRAGQPIDRADCDDVEIVAANLDVVDPGVIGELVQQMTRLVPACFIKVVDIQRLPATDEDASCRVESHGEKRSVRR